MELEMIKEKKNQQINLTKEMVKQSIEDCKLK